MQPGSLVQQSFTRSFLGCIVYVSEGRSKPIIDQLETVARHASRHVKLASLFQDSPYNRSNFCLVGRDVHHLALAAVHLSRAAFQLVDLERHAATHPRLGVVDHISCHPLGSLQADPEGLRHAASLARTLGQQLGAGDQAVPVYLYGAAHPQHHSLDSIRRSLGYFQGAAQGQWRGAIPMAAPSCQQSGSGSAEEAPHPTPLPLTPDFGLPHARPSRGVCCVGASPWVVNFNVLLSEGVGKTAARKIARRVSERGGGLRGVQAMALQHSKGVEIACNLLDPHGIPPEAVERRVAELAQAEGGSVVDSYRIGMGPEDLLDIARQL